MNLIQFQEQIVDKISIPKQKFKLSSSKYISELSNLFASSSLTDLEKLCLLNRHDTKYMFNVKKLPVLLEMICEDYSILDIDGCREFSYQNVYFDTDDYKLYTNHHNGKLNRYKVRYRHYVETDDYYFEMKFKSNKRKTFKDRMKKCGFESKINGGADILLAQKAGIDSDLLSSKIRIEYTRMTFIHKRLPEKLTIDYNLVFSNDEKKISAKGLVIAEVKKDLSCSQTEFGKSAKEKGIYPFSISKYCLGALLCCDNIKYNRFKPKLLKIGNICDGFIDECAAGSRSV